MRLPLECYSDLISVSQKGHACRKNFKYVFYVAKLLKYPLQAKKERNFASWGRAPSCDTVMLPKVGGDGVVTNDTEAGDKKEVEGEGNEVEGENEGDEKEETAEEETVDRNLADEGDITLAVFQLFY